MSGFRSSAILGLRRPRLSGTRSTSATASEGLTHRRARLGALEEAVQLLDVGFVEIDLGRGGLDRWIYACARPIHRSEEATPASPPVRVIEADCSGSDIGESSVLLCDRVARGRSARRVCARPLKWRAQGSLLIGREGATAVRPRRLSRTFNHHDRCVSVGRQFTRKRSPRVPQR